MREGRVTRCLVCLRPRHERYGVDEVAFRVPAVSSTQSFSSRRWHTLHRRFRPFRSYRVSYLLHVVSRRPIWHRFVNSSRHRPTRKDIACALLSCNTVRVSMTFVSGGNSAALSGQPKAHLRQLQERVNYWTQIPWLLYTAKPDLEVDLWRT